MTRPSPILLLLLPLLLLLSSGGGATAAAASPSPDSSPDSPPPPPHPPSWSSSSGRSAERRRALLQSSSSSSASAAVGRAVNCTALPGLQACAEPLCFDSFELRRNATSGSVECRPLPAPSPSALNLLFPAYDGDYVFLSTGDNALAAASVVDNTNTGRRFTTREGSLRLRAPFTERTRNAGSVLGGWLGRFSQRRASAEVASSWAVGTNGQRPLQTETSIGTAALPKVAATSKRGFYGPGFTAVGRGAAASDDPEEQGGSVGDNVALDVTAPFFFGAGRRKKMSMRRRRSLLQRGGGYRGGRGAPFLAEEGRAGDEEDLAALRAQLGRLVDKGAIKGDAMFGLKQQQPAADADAGADDAGSAGGAGERAGQLRTGGNGGGSGGGPSPSSSSSSSGSGSGSSPESSDLAPALLPFCRPRLGLLCSDTDLLRVLRKARPDAVLLSEDAPAWAEAFGTLEVDPRLLVRTDPIAGPLPAASAVANSKLDGRIGALPLNAALKSTLASTAFGLAPAPYSSAGAAPGLAFTLGQSRGEATLEAREARARLVVFPGANFGSLAGLTTVEATQG